ncbi:Hypothetical protein A7982_04978 [Minicystis rosea]|nr:Hypothetical protein A7982_04978 [Minicystis rosea]
MTPKLILRVVAALAFVSLAPACAKTTQSPPDAPPGCAVLEPGHGVGRFTLGTQLKAPESVTPDTRPGWFRPTALDAPDTHLRFDGDKRLVELETPLPACVTLAGRTLDKPDPQKLAAALGTCGPMEILEGGNRIPCDGLVIISGTLGPDGKIAPPILHFGAKTAAPKPGCNIYFDKDARVDDGGVKAVNTVKLGEKDVVCVAGQSKPLTTATRPADVNHAGCREIPLRGGTRVQCGEQTYSFAGPMLVLDTVTIGAEP